ncbi:(2Fe-2S)-binding protein [Kushneria aurantia]|uniref:(2Fe-2S)-binding protein n=1 Tax=Kushneria aurantia TaxID=504092 RepID=A0ABV6G7J2_9GAMM|nr:(2Fe-2S)-binding protein [Kushneria aurantia]
MAPTPYSRPGVGYCTPAAQAEIAERPSAAGGASAGNTRNVTLSVNGEQHRLALEPNAILLDVLREELGLFGTKKGCDHGQCGACTVHVNGRSVNACLMLACMQEGAEITTIEGLARSAGYEQGQHPIQEAFLEHDAYQCGYCTAGQMMTAAAVLNDRAVAADAASVNDAMSGNICRCGAYKNIREAIETARQRMQGES